jgi:hypothetical protein
MRYARNTQVSTDRSIGEIKRIVERYGATSFVFGSSDGVGVVGFEIQKRAVRIRVPMPKAEEFKETPTGRGRDDYTIRLELEKASRQRWRCLCLVVKAKLEAVESGISSVENEFLSNILVEGNRTVGEILKSKVAAAYLGVGAPKLLEAFAGTKED